MVIAHLAGRYIQEDQSGTNISDKKTELYHQVATEILRGLGVDICEASTGKRKYSLDMWRVHLLPSHLRTIITAVKGNVKLFFGSPFYRITKT